MLQQSIALCNTISPAEISIRQINSANALAPFGENEITVSPPNFLGNSGSFWNDKQAGNRGIAPYYLSLVET
jgi:hypothetical protein